MLVSQPSSAANSRAASPSGLQQTTFSNLNAASGFLSSANPASTDALLIGLNAAAASATDSSAGYSSPRAAALLAANAANAFAANAAAASLVAANGLPTGAGGLGSSNPASLDTSPTGIGAGINGNLPASSIFKPMMAPFAGGSARFTPVNAAARAVAAGGSMSGTATPTAAGAGWNSPLFQRTLTAPGMPGSGANTPTLGQSFAGDAGFPSGGNSLPLNGAIGSASGAFTPGGSNARPGLQAPPVPTHGSFETTQPNVYNICLPAGLHAGSTFSISLNIATPVNSCANCCGTGASGGSNAAPGSHHNKPRSATNPSSSYPGTRFRTSARNLSRAASPDSASNAPSDDGSDDDVDTQDRGHGSSSSINTSNNNSNSNNNNNSNNDDGDYGSDDSDTEGPNSSGKRRRARNANYNDTAREVKRPATGFTAALPDEVVNEMRQLAHSIATCEELPEDVRAPRTGIGCMIALFEMLEPAEIEEHVRLSKAAWSTVAEFCVNDGRPDDLPPRAHHFSTPAYKKLIEEWTESYFEDCPKKIALLRVFDVARMVFKKRFRGGEDA
ncbi:hypothetical protein CAOG_02781 [Capsaspora owczarzaki ATCC 30864]|uniref:Uncharacterized protein n=1 Tax=Capsaspora owczarzaki (strain ATCC 30864) TaxID=595528 RepID=A0A0D2VN58_CAPO3|nr:hypothetical protein CAOG_02781 [Capsaspora owczarzaki ATCC 30864]KJE91677.1 hypothetical protein CAOG_002781 [Capsaspora owczarzaki ATCC 30864]|eukprot:XP_004349534.1 hypothetical protein CAOG_02781 [Capsaspora owczarzaki ATCC 30864]